MHAGRHSVVPEGDRLRVAERRSSRIAPLVLILILVLALASCTFERRPDRAENGNGDAGADLFRDGEARELQPVDSVLLVVQLYREALEVGDLSRALSFLHPGAALHSNAAALLPTGSSAGEVLLQELRLRQDGLRLEVLDSEATLLGDAALVVKRYRVLVGVADDASESRSGDIAIETVILVRSANGWRIRHLHRSTTDAG
jgi:hypothetical protein